MTDQDTTKQQAAKPAGENKPTEKSTQQQDRPQRSHDRSRPHHGQRREGGQRNFSNRNGDRRGPRDGRPARDANGKPTGDANKGPRDPNAKPPRNRNRGRGRGGDRNRSGGDRNRRGRGRGRGGRGDNDMPELDSVVINVRRVTRVVKGGKRMRFSALVVLGDKKGKVGFGLSKGVDYQDAVAKATKQAKKSLIVIKITDDGSIEFPTQTKHKSCVVMLKPATKGTGLIAGGYLRPVLTLAGVNNIYSKIIRSNNKVVGVQAAFKALEHYKK